jgi:hypothetical protein
MAGQIEGVQASKTPTCASNDHDLFSEVDHGPALRCDEPHRLPQWRSARTCRRVVRPNDVGAQIISKPAVHFSGDRIYVASDCGAQQWIFAEPA